MYTLSVDGLIMNSSTIAELYQYAFSNSKPVLLGDQPFRFSVARVGTLLLPSGRIVACDPLVAQDRKPFVQSVPPGRYVVDLAIAKRERDGDERVAFGRILFSRMTPVIWVKALRQDEKVEATQDGEAFGYPVSSNTASFMDAETAGMFRLATMAEVDQLLDDLVAKFKPTRTWLEHSLDEKHNVMLFSSGYGKGVYPSYFAIDEAGDVCLLVTVFWQG
jgi:hypothetical protein